MFLQKQDCQYLKLVIDKTMNLIQSRLKTLKKVDISVLQFNEEKAQKESLKEWSQSPDGELREDTNVYPKKSPFISATAWIP